MKFTLENGKTIEANVSFSTCSGRHFQHYVEVFDHQWDSYKGVTRRPVKKTCYLDKNNRCYFMWNNERIYADEYTSMDPKEFNQYLIKTPGFLDSFICKEFIKLVENYATEIGICIPQPEYDEVLKATIADASSFLGDDIYEDTVPLQYHPYKRNSFSLRLSIKGVIERLKNGTWNLMPVQELFSKGYVLSNF